MLGVILLLPGLCAIVSFFGAFQLLWTDPPTFFLFVLLWAFCFALGYGGIVLIRRAAGR